MKSAMIFGLCLAASVFAAAADAPKPFDHGDDADVNKLKQAEKSDVVNPMPDRPLAKCELKDKIYHGVLIWTDKKDGFTKIYDQYVKVAGKKPSMIGTFDCIWSNSVKQPDDSFEQRLKIIDEIPNVIPFMKVYTGDWKPGCPFLSADEILAGKHDQYFKNMAGYCKKYAKPMMVSFNHEMNGDWFFYSELYKKEKTDWTAEKYIKIWRKIHGIFKDEGVTNVAFVWCPQMTGRPYKELNAQNSFKAYYPGDEYVDWIGPSFYNDVNHMYMDNLVKTYPSKPIVLAEWGTEPNRGQWYVPKPYPGDAKHMEMTLNLFPKKYPNIKAMTYFYWGKDVNIERLPEQVEIYQKGISGEKFLSNE
ncbi:MAG: hypothetical protein A2X48_04825 [Lentisphaerae bacterium GWF2_49_21]|nr:MAG: hypothetical protein A2X48_04825 [Lentisphaerae bacterium GWF2_49_21]